MTTTEKIYTCRCGELDGNEHCEWTGSLDELELVEYMPIYHRDSHSAARNSGIWPQNGAVRAAVHWECADRFEEYEGDPDTWPDGCTWFERLGGPSNLASYAEEKEMTKQQFQTAVDRLDATELADGSYAYYADETRTYYVVSVEDMELLAEMMEDPEYADAYSEWCAATDSVEATSEQLTELGV